MYARMVRTAGATFALYLLLIPLLSSLLSSAVYAAPNAAPHAQTGAGEGEPNDNFGAAATIALGATIEGTIAPVNDVDWYALTVEHQGELTVSVTDVADTLAIAVRVWNSDKSTVSGWYAPLAAGGETLAVVDLALPGRYFLEVTDNAGGVESSQPYVLQTSFVPTADADELNNTFGTAAPLAFDQPIQANILPADDDDWYRVEVDHLGELSLQITDAADNLAISVRVWNNDKQTVSGWISPLTAGGDTIGIVDLPEAGRYFLEVAANDGERSTEPYTLTASFIAAADQGERNNVFGAATPFTLGESIEATILPRDDTDWYRVAVDHHGELRVAVTDVPATMAIRLRVWNANKQTISDWIAPLAVGGETLGFVDLPLAGNYYVEVDDANDERSVEPFTLNLAFTAAADPNEANNSFGSASELTLGQSLPSNILPRGDSDWHWVDLSHQGELQISATDVPENLDISIRVWDSNKQTISSWFAPLARGGNTAATVDIPKAGSYYLEVVDGSNDARSITPFLLQARFLPAADQGEPNNTFETATAVGLDTTIPANILPANDADWCRLELTETGELHVLITNVAPNLELAMRLWDETEDVLVNWVYPLAAGGDTVAVFPITEPGVYYLEVVDNRRGRSIQPYLLRFSMEEIDPADMTYSQTVSATDTLTDTVVTVSAGTETVTVTTTIVTTTVTVQASGAVDESDIVTATETLTNTSVITRSVTPGSDAPDGDVPESDTPEDEATEGDTPDSDTAESDTSESDASDSDTSRDGTPPPPSAPTTPRGDGSAEDTAAAPTTPAEVPEGETIDVDGVAVALPADWHAAAESGPFRGVALNPDDLTAAIPQGPRLWVLQPGVADLELTGMLEAVGDTVQVVEEASIVQVGEVSAITFDVQEMFGETGVMRRYVFVNTGAGDAYAFILEAPADQWDAQVSLLEGILASIVIEPSVTAPS